MAFSKLKKELKELVSAEDVPLGDLSFAILGVIGKAGSEAEERELVQFVIENFWLLTSSRKIELETALSRQEFNRIVESLSQYNLLEDLFVIFQKNNNTPQDTAKAFVEYLRKFNKKECSVILTVAASSFLPYVYFPNLPEQVDHQQLSAILNRYHRQFVMIERMLKQESWCSQRKVAKILRVIESLTDPQAKVLAFTYAMSATQKMSAPVQIIPIIDPRALQNAMFSNPAGAADVDDEPPPPLDKNKLI
ncbi:MAG: hypothetical protein V1928_03880 [Parcubacteria group bacterium]